MKAARQTWWANLPQQYEEERPLKVLAGQRWRKPNLVSSLTDKGSHAPAIDLDFPATLLESKTPGHYHLYLHKELTWLQYRKLLRCLAAVGIIEKGYLKASETRQASFLRINEFSILSVRHGEQEEPGPKGEDPAEQEDFSWH